MSDDEQSPGGRTLRTGKKNDGPNWFMIAGGAVVMAVSVAFGRKKILNEGEKVKERSPNGGARSQAASDGTVSCSNFFVWLSEIFQCRSSVGRPQFQNIWIDFHDAKFFFI